MFYDPKARLFHKAVLKKYNSQSKKEHTIYTIDRANIYFVGQKGSFLAPDETLVVCVGHNGLMHRILENEVCLSRM